MIYHHDDLKTDSYLPRMRIRHSITVECAENETVTAFIHALNETRKLVPADQFDTCELCIGGYEDENEDYIRFYLMETDEEWRQRRERVHTMREHNCDTQLGNARRRLENTWRRADEYSVVVPELEAVVVEAELELVKLVMPIPERPRNPRLL